MKKSNLTVLIVLLSCLFVIVAAGIIISYYEFYTPNFLSVGFGAVASLSSDSACIKISNSPLIMMTRNNKDGRAAIKEYMLLNGGYTVKEQMGPLYIYENEDSKIHVDSDQKIYWIIWKISDPKPKN